MPQWFREKVGFPPFHLFVRFELGCFAFESGVVLFDFLGGADDDRAEAVWVRGVKAHFVADPLGAFTATMGSFPPNIHPERVPAVCSEHCRFTPERVPVRVILQERAAVAPPVAYDLDQPFARDADELGRAVGWVMHRRKTVPPGPFAAFEIENLESRMLVFCFAVVKVAELAFFVELAGRYCGLLVVSGLGHHVDEPAFFHRIEKQFGLFDASPCCRDSGYCVLAVFHGFDDMLNMQGAVGEYCDCVYAGIFDQFLEGRVSFCAVIDFHQSLPAVFAQIAYRGDDAIRVFVPLKV